VPLRTEEYITLEIDTINDIKFVVIREKKSTRFFTTVTLFSTTR